MPITPATSRLITRSKVILVEGNDEVVFLSELLKYLRLEHEVQPREVGGKFKFRSEFPAFLKDPHFNRVTAYAVIRDADDDFKSTLDSIQGLLTENEQPCPDNHGRFASNEHVKVGLFIMPGNVAGNMLEDLCLQTVKDHPVMPHVENFMVGLKADKNVQYPRNESKAKIQAFLAGMYDITERIGTAAKKGYWPFGHQALAELRNFLKELSV